MFWTTDGESINCLMIIYTEDCIPFLSLYSQNKLFCHNIYLKYFWLMISVCAIE